MKVVLINQEKLFPEIVDTPGGVDEWKRLINCKHIDIVWRRINGRRFAVVADDEGLLKDNTKVTAITPDGKPALAGNLVILNADDEGNERTLTDNDIEWIRDNSIIVRDGNTDQPRRWVAISNVTG